MQTNDNLVEQVNKIIQTNIDRREGYEKAIDEIKDPSLNCYSRSVVSRAMRM
jgi:hypothetical protein